MMAGTPTASRRCRRHPSVTVDVIVVRAHISVAVYRPREGVVGWNIPRESRPAHRRMEAQILSGVVHPRVTVQPHALQVEWHIDFIARIGVVAEDPDLVVRRVHSLLPHLVHQHVRLDLVIVAAINHDLALCVQVTHRPRGLRMREIPDRRGRGRQAHQRHNYNECNAFHGCRVLLVLLISYCKGTKTFQHGKKNVSLHP